MARKEDYIAVFDSGVGGISVLRHLLRVLPNEKFLYFGDSIHAPYGVRPREEVEQLTMAALEKLMEQRQHYRYATGDTPVRVSDGVEKYHLGVAAPILCQGDLMGCVLLLMGEDPSPMPESDQRLAQTVAGFLGKQMES